jgi:hypothetical protein
MPSTSSSSDWSKPYFRSDCRGIGDCRRKVDPEAKRACSRPGSRNGRASRVRRRAARLLYPAAVTKLRARSAHPQSRAAPERASRQRGIAVDVGILG